MNIYWFKRGDGILFCAEQGSASYELFTRSGEFTPCDSEGNEIPYQFDSIELIDVKRGTDTDLPDESEPQTEQPDVADPEEKGDAGQGGSAVGGGAGVGSKADDYGKPARRKDVPPRGDNKEGDKIKPDPRAKKVKEK